MGSRRFETADMNSYQPAESDSKPTKETEDQSSKQNLLEASVLEMLDSLHRHPPRMGKKRR